VPDAADSGGNTTDSGNPADTGGPTGNDASDATPPMDAPVDSTTGGDDSSGPGDGGDAAPSMDAGDAAKDSGGTDASGIGPGNAACNMAMPFGVSETNDAVLLSPDTTGAAHTIDAPCLTGSAPEVFYAFTINSPMFVYADSFGSSWNTALFLLSNSCMPIATAAITGGAVCNDDACSTTQSQIVTVLPSGKYKLGVTGPASGTNSGTAIVHFRVALAASGTETQLPQGATMQSGTTSGNMSNLGGIAGSGCVAAGPENGYWWTSCPSDPGGMLSASTCSGVTGWEPVLELEVPGTTTYRCAQDSCGLQTALNATIPAGAGLRVLAIDGNTAADLGAYTLSVTRP
jgi:hypothetical protein